MNKQPFNEWFVGFSDGESNFTIGLDKRGKTPNFNFRFMIGLHIDDKPLLKYILTNIGCGYIQDNKNKHASYFIITNPYILKFLKGMLDPYSLIKADASKLFNLNIEKAKGNTKDKIKFSIFQLDFLVNIFIPFLESLNFKSKKSLDFYDFKIITLLIYQGKHLITDVKSYIFLLSYSMNNYRLSTNTDVKKNLNITYTTDKKLFYSIIKKFLSLPPLFILNDSGQIINYKTGDIVRDVFVIELIKTDNTVEIYPTITDTAISYKVSRNTISSLISNGRSLIDKEISKINKIRVYKKL